MDLKMCLLVVIFLAAILDQPNHQAVADFFYNRVWPKAEELQQHDFKCIPGRTVIKIVDKDEYEENSGEYEDQVAGDTLRRSHMISKKKEEYCQICVCSVEGKDEYCSKRPAMNVNECLMISSMQTRLETNQPFDHSRSLSQRIRRDYIWHNDEIPYEAKAKCRRGHSYYSNYEKANATTIDVASDIESLLDYPNKTICSYCVCSFDGNGVSCIGRDAWFCDYYRNISKPDAARDRYRTIHKKDMPSYFRQLSFRLRRTMDDGMFDLIETVGGGDVAKNSGKCVPFVSEYTDCTDENLCSGCHKCLCGENSQWTCEKVQQCPGDEPEMMDEESLDNALYRIQYEMEEQEKAERATAKTSYVPLPPAENDKDLLLDIYETTEYDIDERIAEMMRNKRSVNEHANKTDGVMFHHTVDELNEDTLKHGNISGTLQAHKRDGKVNPKASRRTGVLPNENVSKNSLHIEYSQPKVYDHHLTDNKIDAAVHADEKYNSLIQKDTQIMGNHTQKEKDKYLSKLVVNELQSGTEIVGDKDAPIISNITFTPENDTLTAMAFIAGNLLNQLWNMAKDSGEDSVETEVLKHEKIADLLDLFKEPLNLRQESFLKNALEQLSEAIDQDKTLKNITLCDAVKIENNIESSESHASEERNNQTESKKSEKSDTRKTNIEKQKHVTTEALSEINNVLSMINNFQLVQKKLNTLKGSTDTVKKDIKKEGLQPPVVDRSPSLAQDESDSLNVFGNILKTITKLLLPRKQSKKMTKSIKNLNVLKNTKHIPEALKSAYNIDIVDSQLTAKDKIVFDYLNTVQKNPKCLLEHVRNDNVNYVSKIEGNILLNLSEFFKVKSFIDLFKLIEPETKAVMRVSEVTTTMKTETEQTTATTVNLPSTTELSNKLAKTKEKLKTHLKTIIDDLIELQSEKGQSSSNINIADALPCIYNILNADKELQSTVLNNEEKLTPTDKVAKIFNSLKKDLQSPQTRRTGVTLGPRPKSAVVWERLINNFDGRNTLNTRRSNVKIPKTFDEVKKMIKEIESNPKSFKNEPLINEVPPSERLVLLKTLSVDTDQYITVLEEVKKTLHSFKDMSPDQKNTLKDFIMNAERNINRNNQIFKTMSSKKVNSVHQSKLRNQMYEPKKQAYIQKQSMKMLDGTTTKDENSMKLTRDSIINQLIKNRMQLYLKLKESKGTDLSYDINYDIAKKVLLYLETGKTNLARELYKVLISQKQKTDSVSDQLSAPSAIQKPQPFPKETVIQFEEPKSQVQWVSQDTWLKQLVNLKNMKS